MAGFASTRDLWADYVFASPRSPRPAVVVGLALRIHRTYRDLRERQKDKGGPMDVYAELERATGRWSMPVIVRTYKRDRKGEDRMREEVRLLAIKHYEPATQSEDGGHIHAGRLLLTGGFSILAGRSGIRSQGDVTITFRKVVASASFAAATPAVEIQREESPITKLQALAEMRERGLINETEYEAKKTELLSRM
jgi:hypothetical protein